MLPFLSLQGPLHIKKFQRNMKLFLYNKLKIEFQNLTFESLNNGKNHRFEDSCVAKLPHTTYISGTTQQPPTYNFPYAC